MNPEAKIQKAIIKALSERFGALVLPVESKGKRGFPDLIVLYEYECIFLEVKTPKGRLSKGQIAMRKAFAQQGHCIFRVCCVEDAINAFTASFRGH